MYALPKSNYLKRSLLVNGRGQVYDMSPSLVSHSQRIRNRLKELGLSRYALIKAESRYLPHVIRKNEQLGGVAYGQGDDGFAMLVATDRRVIFLDKKPLFINEDEVSYFSVSGVSLNHTIIGSEVILHTRLKDYKIYALNKHCAETFVQYIESRCLAYKTTQGKDSNDEYGYNIRT